MRKNAPYQKRYDALKARLDRAAERTNRAKIQMDALAKVVKTDRSNVRRYKVAAPEKVQDRPGIIAEAVSGNEHYASLVATMRDDNSALKMTAESICSIISFHTIRHICCPPLCTLRF